MIDDQRSTPIASIVEPPEEAELLVGFTLWDDDDGDDDAAAAVGSRKKKTSLHSVNANINDLCTFSPRDEKVLSAEVLFFT